MGVRKMGETESELTGVTAHASVPSENGARHLPLSQ